MYRIMSGLHLKNDGMGDAHPGIVVLPYGDAVDRIRKPCPWRFTGTVLLMKFIGISGLTIVGNRAATHSKPDDLIGKSILRIDSK